MYHIHIASLPYPFLPEGIIQVYNIFGLITDLRNNDGTYLFIFNSFSVIRLDV